MEKTLNAGSGRKIGRSGAWKRGILCSVFICENNYLLDLPGILPNQKRWGQEKNDID
jgi:hypothetical protein